MTEENFIYWLQGYMEIANNPTLDEGQWHIIREHLLLVSRHTRIENKFILWLAEQMMGSQRPSATSVAERLHKEFVHINADTSHDPFDDIRPQRGFVIC